MRLSQPAVRPYGALIVLATSPGHVALLSPSFSRENPSLQRCKEEINTRAASRTTFQQRIHQIQRTMNIFRLTGDLSHLAAIIILLLKIWKSRSCAGISGKSQILFALVFTTRYLDLLTSFISLYNTIMKVIYIACAYATVYLIYAKFKATYDGNHDTFRVEFLVVPVGGLAFLVNHDFSPLEILWTFSIYLESVSILPQLFMISKTGEAETITTHYLFFLGLYRALYLINWIWRFYFESFFDMIAIVAGIVQTILYCDFFYLYVTKA
ncbi:ER lumen -retaining receptor 2 [Labeo rohita]|uniref:ER lumen-retaining receptor 2 n=1 Tax=Labeo rohita TaxID=84645 RepID=A0A498NHJ2_LABRO|nr:ER lumen -retaining receptor 2 [Labeo rohita]